MPLRHLLRVLGDEPKDARNLTREESFGAMTSILSGGESEVTVGAFLMALRWKGFTVEELTGFAQAARAQARIPCRDVPGLVTVCPPHDGQAHHPPLDAVAGLIASAAGARVLMVTDRGVPPLRGLTAANVLEGLGLSMTWDPSEAEDWVVKGGFACLAATGMLPGLLHTRRVRKDLVLRTPLSTLEKLLAPAHSAVVLGAMGGPVLGTAVEVIQALGHPRGVAVQEALVQAGVTRFRPVILTALTTILGLVPMALGISIDFQNLRVIMGSPSTQWWGPMAVAVIFGLAFATLLTLVMVPTMYSILDDLRGLRGRRRTRVSTPEPAVHGGAPADGLVATRTAVSG